MCTFGVEFIHFAMIEKLQGVVLRTIKYNDKNAGSLTVRGEIFFENNWLTIW